MHDIVATEIGPIVVSTKPANPDDWDGCTWVTHITSRITTPARFAWDGYTEMRGAKAAHKGLVSDVAGLVSLVRSVAEDSA